MQYAVFRQRYDPTKTRGGPPANASYAQRATPAEVETGFRYTLRVGSNLPQHLLQQPRQQFRPRLDLRTLTMAVWQKGHRDRDVPSQDRASPNRT